MKVLLLQDVLRVGQKGEIVNVKDGYGRNYLIREGLARFADEAALREAELHRQSIQKTHKKKIAALNEYEERLLGPVLEIKKKANLQGHLFAAFTAHEAVELLRRQGFALLKEEGFSGLPLKTAGEHTIEISL